jgi:hypothetical protein
MLPFSPFGLQPYSTLSGAPWNGQAHAYAINPSSTGTFCVGTPVVSSSLAGDPKYGLPLIDIPASNQVSIRGVIVAVSKDPFLNGYAGSTPDKIIATPSDGKGPYYAMVVDDPNVLFTVQCDGTGGGFTQISVNQYCHAGTSSYEPSVTNGYISTIGLICGTLTSAQPPFSGSMGGSFQALRLAPIINNSYGANPVVVVRIAVHDFNRS